MIVTNSGDTTLTVDFEGFVAPDSASVALSSYVLTNASGERVYVKGVEISYSVLDSGTGALSGTGLTSNTFLPGVGHGVTAPAFLTLGDPFHEVFLPIVAADSTTFTLDALVPTADPTGGIIPWEVTLGVTGVTLTINKPVNGDDYTLEVSGLSEPDGTPFAATDTFTAAVSQPQVTSATQLDEGQIVVTFSEAMRNDSDLTDPSQYTFTGPSTVRVKRVYALSETQVMLTTVGLEDGAYTLTVNATGTPHDLAGNPMDPVFNTAAFTGSPALASRSVFVDHGPIAKPTLSIQTGATATIDSPTQITLPTATIDPSHVGLYITLSGTAINAGSYRITTRVSATVVRVAASFSLPDASNGAISWDLYDPRNGQIADDPSDVTVRVNGGDVTPDAVIGLLGQVVLPSVPDPADNVEVDYCWVCNPVVDVRRLNSQEFRLNNWNRDLGRPVDSYQHKYRYNNVLVQPETYVPLDIQATVAQPLQRDLKYRAYERAYSVALNDPNLLLLNSPNPRIAFPPLSRTIESTFVDYQATTLPENNTTAPWVLNGTGNASVASYLLSVEDTTTGPFPGGEPFYWERGLDLSYPHVFAIAWRNVVTSVNAYDGVFSGVSVGYADDQKAIVLGYLNDGGTNKIGILRAKQGNDPSLLTAWTGGVDAFGSPTEAPVEVDWSVIHSYRIFREQTGTISVYLDGSVTPILRVLPGDLPYLEELNAPFDSLQGAFFGSLSREAQNQSDWSFVRYTTIPINPLQSKPSVFVSYEATTPPEEASQPWVPVGFHGTDTIASSDFLVLDSTSATDDLSSDAAGLVGGDFRGFTRIEPLLSESHSTVLDAKVSLLTHTHGIEPDAAMVAIDDGTRLMQLSLFPETSSPKFSYGGRSLPDEFSPFSWDVNGAETPSMSGQYLRITDDSNADGLVYSYEDASGVGSTSRVVGHTNDYMFEFRVNVESYVADIGGFCGVMTSVYDSLRSVGVMFEEIAGQRYVTLQSDGVAIVGGQFAYDWFDGEFHTYRVSKSTTGDLVSLFIDSEFATSVAYSLFDVPVASITGLVSFGSSTPISTLAQSTTLWAYANFWRVNSGVRKFAGLWKGYDSDSLTGYHLPIITDGLNASVAGNVLTDSLADFVADGVQNDDPVVIDTGGNKGVYYVTAVNPTSLVLSAPFPVQPSLVAYRVVAETDWSTLHKYRIVKDPQGGVSVFLDAQTEPWIHANYNGLDLPPSALGVPGVVANGLPSVTWGAFDPENISQTYWDYVRLGAVRSQSELGIVPHHQVLNQRNIMASYEHHRTTISHDHTNFWSESEGIPPQTEPDLLRDENLTAYTLLNEGTPLVPSTQTYEVRSPQAVLTTLVGLNRPEDVLNTQAFLLNDGQQQVQIVVPDDVLYNCLKVIERTEGESSLIAPFDDECQPDFGTFYYQNEVCLNYDGSVLPEDDSAASTVWTKASDDDAHQFSSVFGGVLTYGTDSTGTRTVYRNNTPLPDAPSLQTEVKFRLRVNQDSTGGLGDSQIRVGFSSSAPGFTVGLAFVTQASGDRYVLAVDLNNGQTVGGIPFDFYDGAYHEYRLIRDPSSASVRIFIDS